MFQMDYQYRRSPLNFVEPKKKIIVTLPLRYKTIFLTEFCAATTSFKYFNPRT